MAQTEPVEDLFDDANGDLALGELETAITKYRRCTELAPDFFDAWHALCMALMKTNQIPDAIEAGKQAVRLNVNDQLGWSSLSLCYVRNDQIKEAEGAGARAKILSWGGKLQPSVIDELNTWPTNPAKPSDKDPT